MENNTNEQEESLHVGNLKIFQDREKFMFGLDAVLLSDFSATEIHKDQNVLDLGTGTGIIPILLSATSNAKSITAIEIQESCAKMAERSVIKNRLQEKIQIVNGDIRNIKSLVEAHSFSAVTMNPPYIKYSGNDNKNEAITIARQEKLAVLDDFVAAADWALKPCGKIYMIHRPERLSDIFKTFSHYSIEPKRIRFVHSFAQKEASMVLIEARKNAKPSLVVESPIIVYEKNGVYSAQINKIYRRREPELQRGSVQHERNTKRGV